MEEHTLKKTVDPTRWVSAYADELFRYALRKTGDNSLADDLVQDQALQSLARNDLLISPSTYFYDGGGCC